MITDVWQNYMKANVVPETMSAKDSNMSTEQTPSRMLTACLYFLNAGMMAKEAENLKTEVTAISAIRMMIHCAMTQYPSSQRSTGW